MDRHAILATIDAIARSPMVEQYLIGVTSDSVSRSAQYTRIGYDHYVVLSLKLSAPRALELERYLFDSATSSKRSSLYRKYHHDKREGRHHSTLGRNRVVGNRKRYDVYIAWWSPSAA